MPDIYADFKLNAAGNRVVECPAGQPGNENRRIQTALPDTEWSGNSSFDIETYLPCRPDAGERLHSKPFFFGCKAAALNVRKLITFRKERGHYAQNPILVI